MPGVRTDEETYDGDWAMHIGVPRGVVVYSQVFSSVESQQPLQLPPGTVASATLRFWYYTESDAQWYDYDRIYVLIYDRWNRIQDEIMSLTAGGRNNQAWLESPEFDLMAYDWPLTVHFEVANNGDWGTTRMYIDDVRVEICMATAAAGRAAYRGHVEVAY